MHRLILLLWVVGLAAGADFQAGVARVKITPEGPIWLSGYGNRSKPSEGAVHDLWAKALVLRDARGSRVVIVTTDLIGLPRSVTELVAGRLQKEYGLDRSRILFNSSHTHTGPVVWPNLVTMFDMDPENERRVREYGQALTEKLWQVAAGALGDMAPADVSYSTGRAGFAMNRREPTPNGVRIGVNREGPTDHDVPVLRVTGADGKLKAVLFGYACHNTTLTGEFYQVSGDYAGFAQYEVERAHPGVTAMFLMLCGGDQNPYPRSKAELAEEHGASLGAEVNRVLAGDMRRVRSPIRTAFRVVEPVFAPHSREDFEKELESSNAHRVRRARLMLKAYDERRPVRRIPYPVQAVRFGRDLTLLALGGEVVVDYALRAKREFGGAEGLIIAGYSNDVMCYIPSARVLKEGGYEAVDSMIYYGQPGPFTEEVEETVWGGVRAVMKRVGR
ncbi:MAG: neutral/alkaline non-lysosomal ceramidase N-terminal domain-containing protein [Bryobacteraceae bacterium]